MSAADSAAPFIFIVAAEPSGDALGGALIRALQERTGGALRIAGIGGEHMAAERLGSLVPISELAVVGCVEVLSRAPLIFRRVREAVAAIRRDRPDAVVTIDSSAFSWRIAQRLRRRRDAVLLIHYVAPMVWAWRGGRARRMARWYDHLMVLLPFEPPYFDRVGLSCSYVGHPVLDSGAERGDGDRFRREHGLGRDELLLTVLPGSRAGEVARLSPIFAAALQRLWPMLGPFRVAVPTVATVAEAVSETVRAWPGQPIVLRGDRAKYDAFAASRAALAASGTVALELALAKVPMVVAYRVSRLTEAMLARIIKVRHANLINLILDRPLVPELLGPRCTPEGLADAVAELVLDERVRAAHKEGYDEALRRLGQGGLSPSLQAADRILSIVAARRQRVLPA